MLETVFSILFIYFLIENTISNNTSIFACVSNSEGMCSQSRCLETTPVYLVI
jgi:hypothetical protein